MNASHPSSRRTGFFRRRAVTLTVAALVAVALLTGLGLVISAVGGRDGSSSSSSSNAAGSAGSESSGTAGTATAPRAADSAAAPAAGGDASSGTGSGTLTSVPAAQNRVVQTGQLSLDVAKGKVASTLDRLNGIASGAGGFLSSSKLSSFGLDSEAASPSGTSTLRVPTAKYDGVVAQVRRLGTVTSLSSSATDVTAEYVDRDARIRALQDTRSTLLTLLSQATSIGDTLAVQQQIQPVQQQIEQLQGQQRVLASQSDLATLAVTVGELNAPVRATEAKHKRSGFAAAWHRTATGFNVGLQALITVLGPLLLILLVGGALVFGVRTALRRRLRRRLPGTLSE